MAKLYNIPTLIKGDTFEDLIFSISINSFPEDLTNYTIACKFRRGNKTGRVAKEINTITGITIVDAVGGIFKIDEFLCDFDADTYYYDIQFTDGNGVVSTYIQGIFKVEQDVTY